MIPPWLRRLERLLLRDDDREFLAGDLEEDYWDAVRRFGHWRGVLRYVRGLLRASSRTGATMLTRFWSDLQHAQRTLARRPVFALAAAATLSIGIGATTAIYTIADAALLAPLAYPNAERLLFVSSGFPGATAGGDQLSYLDIREIAERNHTLEAIGPYNTSFALQMRGTAGAQPERVRANVVGPQYLALLGARAARGRLLGPEDDRTPNAHPVVVVTDAFWQRRLAGDPDVIGRTVTLSDVALTIVGVLEPGFRDVSAEEGYQFASDVFVPAMMLPSFGAATYFADRNARNFWALARVRDGVSLQRAQADVAAIGDLLQREQASTNKGFTFWAERLDAHLARDIRGPLLLLAAASAFVLLIGCSNVANLLLAHLSARSRELAVRRALGAGRAHVASLLFAESSVLAAGGGVLGILLATMGTGAFRAIAPASMAPRLESASVNGAALVVATVLTVGVGLALVAIAGVRVSGARELDALHAGGRSATDAAGARTRRLLLVAEVASAVVLVIGAALMLDSLVRLRSTGVGFRTERLLTLQMNLTSARYANGPTVVQFGADLVRELRALPAVESALIWGPARPGRNTWVTFPGREDATPSIERLMTWRHTVNPGALGDLGIALRRGRDFSDHDTLASPRVVIVSETLARTLWPGEDAVGKRLRWRTDVPDSPLLTVVGVAADAKHRGRLQDLLYPARDVYVPHAQRADRMIVAVVRATRDPAAIAASVRDAVHRLDADLPVFNITTMAEHLAEEEAETRFAAVLMTAYGVVALVLAAVGIYGVLSYHVALRTREMAIRMALGAARGQVVRTVIADGMKPALAGIAIGLAAAAALTQLLASILYRVHPRDPLTFVGVAVALMLVALAATALPARRATRVEPIEALRAE